MPARVLLRQPTLADEQELLVAARASRALHQPWTHTPALPAEFDVWLQRLALPENQAFLVCRVDSKAIAGVINISGIMRGELQSARLGYYVFAGHERQGFMREGLQQVVQHAFNTLKLQRLEANIQPGNVASLALARACGFSKEGFSPRYLKVRGRWKDHERWAILASH